MGVRGVLGTGEYDPQWLLTPAQQELQAKLIKLELYPWLLTPAQQELQAKLIKLELYPNGLARGAELVTR